MAPIKAIERAIIAFLSEPGRETTYTPQALARYLGVDQLDVLAATQESSRLVCRNIGLNFDVVALVENDPRKEN